MIGRSTVRSILTGKVAVAYMAVECVAWLSEAHRRPIDSLVGCTTSKSIA